LSVVTHPDKAAHYRERAGHCQQEAERAANKQIRNHYLALAKAYAKLAENENQMARKRAT